MKNAGDEAQRENGRSNVWKDQWPRGGKLRLSLYQVPSSCGRGKLRPGRGGPGFRLHWAQRLEHTGLVPAWGALLHLSEEHVEATWESAEGG